MAVAATSSSQAEYDVFLSFRGDTRNTFTSHLYAALRRKSIKTFIDDKEIKKGNELSPILHDAIEGSKISIVIFSKKYASSTWCLNELLKIIECKKTGGQILLPVFYRIDPSHVRKQSGPYEKAFAKHERDNQAKIQKWRMAMCEAANCVGWDSLNSRLESELVDRIVDDVLQKLNYMINPQVPSSLVGIHQKVEHIKLLLCNRSTNVHILGIWGMGGIGKTTIADVLFKKLSHHFDGCCFIDVKEELKIHGKLELRRKLLTQILGDQKLYICTPSIHSTFVEDRLKRRKVLIVFDDVSDSRQIEDLIGENDQFGPGSIIIVTTRDKDVLMYENGVIYYKVVPLDDEEALHLFSLKAFQRDQPKEEFKQISEMIVNYAKGLPLALKLLGSLLYSKILGEWEDTLEKLKKFPDAKIHHVLSLSYEGLGSNEKSIFLDIACCLKGEPKWHVKSLLDSCGFCGETELRTLENKSLISISYDGKVGMHDLIQKMGQQIVREESIKEFEKRSRLWEPDEVYRVLKCKTGMNHSTESILLDLSKIKDVEISPKTFTRMHKLRLLKFFLPNFDKRCNVHISEGLDGFPDELYYFRWDSFPLKGLPQSFCAEMLVQLDLKESFVEKLWEGEQDLSNLKSLVLSGSKHLVELPNLSKAKNLEEIHLDYCVSLQDIPSCIFSLDRLMALNLSGCIVLQCIRSEHSSSLRWLNLSGCSRLSKFSVTSNKLEYLSLDGTALEELPFSVGGAKNLSFLSLARCKMLENLPSNFYSIGLDTCVKITNCPKLRILPSVFETSSSITSLCLDNCSNLSNLPENLSLLSTLNEMSLQGSSIKALPASIKLISHLRSLNVSHCKRLLLLPELPLSLRELDASECASLSTLFMQNSFSSQFHGFSARGGEDVGITFPHCYYSQRYEFYGCKRLGNSERKTLMVEAVNRIKNAVYMLSMLRESAKSDPYSQFCEFSEDDAQSLEYSCRRLCTSLVRRKFPSLFWLRRVESSSVTVKLNGNCCSYCWDHPYAFGIYLSNKEVNTDLGFEGRHKICMQQWDEAPIWSYWKLECNDVRLSLPGSRVPLWFRYRSTKTTNINVKVSPHFNFLAVVFCVVVTNCLPNAKLCLQNVKCECCLENEGRRSQSYRSVYYSGDSEMHLISDTVFVWYDAYTSDRILEAIEKSRGNDQSTTYRPRISFQFSMAQEGLNYQIKECGVKAIYATDLESKNPMEHEELSFESSHQSANESPRHITPTRVVSPSIHDIATVKERTSPALSCIIPMAAAASSKSLSSSSSSSFIASQAKYDVFLNFRGEDTRCIFTCHLYDALCQKNINTFMDDDDEAIERRDELSPTLLAAIEGAKLSIVILSKNYASSRRCLDELVEIMKCREKKQQIVIPLFYRINPSHVRHQGGTYENAFIEHETHNPFKVQNWRTVLREVGKLAGWVATYTRSESELVQNIVKDVLQRMNYIMDPCPSEFVGIHKRVANVESLLCIGSNDVNIVGIWGMGGAGKTSIANALFSKHYSQFQGCCFLENVREEWKNHKSNDLRKNLLTQILGDKNAPDVNSTFVEDWLCRKKILIVLDDVSDPQQLDHLVGKKNRYGPGSKIIVTTRDRSVLQNEYDGLYEVELLDSNEAHQLFCMNAFKQGQPKGKFPHLINMAVDYAGGNPLALKVLGSYFHSKNMREWESALQKLKKFPNENIQNVLRMSFDELDFEEQSILLYVSAALKAVKKWHATRLLGGCGFSTNIAMRILQDKSFIVVKNDQTIWLHDLIQEMGQQIIREESIKKLELRSRLWDPKDIYSVFSHETVLVNVLGLRAYH